MILDTNAISALAQKNRELIRQLDTADGLAVTLISLGEFSYGLRQSIYRDELEHWMRAHLLTGVQILYPDLVTVEHYADIRSELRRAGTPIPANDIWIGALARQHGLPILSQDHHFDRVPRLTRIGW